MSSSCLITLLVVAAAPDAATPENGLAQPVQIQAGGEPIDVEVGHAAPCYDDFDGDGVKDLLVGQFGGGKLRIYRNSGTNATPVYTDFTFFQSDGKDATVPFG